MHATIDFETRSECEIKRSGGWRYALDASTEVLCLAFRLPSWPEGDVCIWHPAICGSPEYCDDWDRLYELLVWVDAGGLIEAHNSAFERGVWKFQLAEKLGWPAVPHRSWRCSAAKAAALALPRALELLCPVLDSSIEKDSAGHKLMMKMSKPRKPRKKELEEWLLYHDDAPMPTLWHETPEMLERLCDYCRVDVLAEEAASAVMPDLSEDETEVYLLDQLINERGFGLDTEAITTALHLIDGEVVRLNAELKTLTRGVVAKATNKGKMKLWLAAQGTQLPDMQGATLDALLAQSSFDVDITDAARRGMQIVRTLGRSSTAKYEAMQKWQCPDGRAHGGLLYHGASTGRWTGKGVQIQNLPRGSIKKDLLGRKWNMDLAWRDILSLSSDDIRARYGNVMEVLSQAIRGAITPAHGNELFIADYAGIEARVVLWLAGDEDGMDIFRQGRDIYCEMASEIYGYEVVANPENQPEERTLGKVGILAGVYQQGWKTFIESALTLGGLTITEETSRNTVSAFRRKFYKVAQMWNDLQNSAIEATRAAGRPVACGKVEWHRDGRFLYCTLPSGRRLAYCDPQVRLRETPWGEKRDSLSFMGVHPLTRKWTRQWTYGGALCNHTTQSTARDIMALAMLRCENTGVYAPAFTVHDEIVAEARLGTGSVSQFVGLLTELPEWADGLPISAEGGCATRYHK